MTIRLKLTLLSVTAFCSALPFQDPWTSQDVVSTADIASAIREGRDKDRVIIHVGFPVLYRSVHIPGTPYGGPGNKPEGLNELKSVLANVPKTKEVVLYCGCCPWDKCPNVRPAYKALKEMGFTRVKVMMVPTNMRTDWVDKGYPIERAATAAEPVSEPAKK